MQRIPLYGSQYLKFLILFSHFIMIFMQIVQCPENYFFFKRKGAETQRDIFFCFFRVHEIKTLRLSGFAFEINANLGKKNISFIEGKNI